MKKDTGNIAAIFRLVQMTGKIFSLDMRADKSSCNVVYLSSHIILIVPRKTLACES